MKSLIRNRNQAKQGIDFTGIQNGKIHPTDIDAVLEFDNKTLILIEVKKSNNDLPTGQKLVLERICDNWTNKEQDRRGIALYVTHNFNDDTKDIPLVDCMVERYYLNGSWYTIKYSLKDTLNRLGKNWNIKKLKI